MNSPIIYKNCVFHYNSPQNFIGKTAVFEKPSLHHQDVKIKELQDDSVKLRQDHSDNTSLKIIDLEMISKSFESSSSNQINKNFNEKCLILSKVVNEEIKNTSDQINKVSKKLLNLQKFDFIEDLKKQQAIKTKLERKIVNLNAFLAVIKHVYDSSELPQQKPPLFLWQTFDNILQNDLIKISDFKRLKYYLTQKVLDSIGLVYLLVEESGLFEKCFWNDDNIIYQFAKVIIIIENDHKFTRNPPYLVQHNAKVKRKVIILNQKSRSYNKLALNLIKN